MLFSTEYDISFQKLTFYEKVLCNIDFNDFWSDYTFYWWYVYFRASTESLDFSSKYNTLTPSLGSGGSSSRSTTAPEPNIDFELDVKVFIDSGKCVLHPKDTKEEDATKKWVVQ